MPPAINHHHCIQAGEESVEFVSLYEVSNGIKLSSRFPCSGSLAQVPCLSLLQAVQHICHVQQPGYGTKHQRVQVRSKLDYGTKKTPLSPYELCAILSLFFSLLLMHHFHLSFCLQHLISSFLFAICNNFFYTSDNFLHQNKNE